MAIRISAEKVQKKRRFGQIRGRLRACPGSASLQREHAASYCMSLRGAKRRDNPFSLQYHKTENNTLGKYVRRNEFARTAANLLGISAGTRIATPVCALVRNDMQKEGRVRGCKDVVRNDMHPPLSLRGAKRRDNPFSLQ